MNVTAVTRFKHGDIYQLLKKLNWTQSELARRAVVHPTRISQIINLRKRPSVEIAQKIQNAFGEVGEFLDILAQWPELFKGLESPAVIEQTREIDIQSLNANPEVFQLESGNSVAASDLREQVEFHISQLPPRHSSLAKAMFIDELDDADIADKFGMSKPNVNSYRYRLSRNIKRKILMEGIEDPQINHLLHSLKNG
jgi:hypothetical protein